MKFFVLFYFITISYFTFAQSDLDYFIKSKVEESYNKIDTSIILISKAINLKPESIYYTQRANLYLKSKDYNNAINDFKKVAESGNNNSNYEIAKCYALIQNWGTN